MIPPLQLPPDELTMGRGHGIRAVGGGVKLTLIRNRIYSNGPLSEWQERVPDRPNLFVRGEKVGIALGGGLAVGMGAADGRAGETLIAHSNVFYDNRAYGRGVRAQYEPLMRASLSHPALDRVPLACPLHHAAPAAALQGAREMGAACAADIGRTVDSAKSELFNNSFLLGSEPCSTGTMITVGTELAFTCSKGTYMTPSPLSIPPDEFVGCQYRCPAGTYGNATDLNNPSCTGQCPPGHYCALSALNSCATLWRRVHVRVSKRHSWMPSFQSSQADDPSIPLASQARQGLDFHSRALLARLYSPTT